MNVSQQIKVLQDTIDQLSKLDGDLPMSVTTHDVKGQLVHHCLDGIYDEDVMTESIEDPIRRIIVEPSHFDNDPDQPVTTVDLVIQYTNS